ncbi:MAG: LPXTG cell wall anchor domain-containing protein [Lachnospiraceae bacterium]|nr:LPXTG cell wall anchor domain-containing protein [Lachnospiraceae bacterium]
MKKKIALLLCAAMVLALAAGCTNDEPETPATVTATPTPGQKKTVTATPTPSPKKEWKLEPTWTPTPTPTLTPEQQAAKEAEEAAKLAASQFNKMINLNFSEAVSVAGDLPALVNDTELSMTDQKTQKFCIPLGVIVKAGKSAAVTVTLQFNSADDEAIRLYGIQGTGDSAKTDVIKIMNPKNTDTFTTTVYMTAKEDFDTLLVASSGWGKYVNNVTVKKITVAPNPKVDLAAVAKISGDLPTVSDTGALICKGGVTQKFAFPLSNTYKAGDVLAVTVTAKFNSTYEEDESFRFYAIQDGSDSAKSDVVKVYNPKDKSTITETILLTINKDAEANQLLVASSGWGKYMNDIEIKSISVQQAEVLDLSKVFTVGGDAVTVLEDGSISAKGGVTSKFAIPSERTDMSKGSDVTAAITFQFNTADDTSVRLYPILDSTDSSCVATPLQFENPGTTDATVITKNFVTSKDANTILLGGKSWGVNLNDVVIKRVVLYQTPVVEKVAEEPAQTPKTGDNSMMIMITLLGIAAVSGVVFFKKREEA